MKQKGVISELSENSSELNLIVGVDEKIDLGKAFILGLQHVLAMDIYVLPIIIAALLGMDIANTALFISMTFFAAGVATIIQTGWGMKLPVMQGPSYVPIGALAAIGKTLGLGAMVGSLIPGAIIIGLLGYPFKILGKIIKKFIPPVVAGTVIVVVGITLMTIAMNNIFGAEGNVGHNVLVSSVSAIMMVVFVMIGVRVKGIGKYVRLSSVILAIAIGTVVASCFGGVDFSPVAKAAWLAAPRPFPFGVPKFDLMAVLTMVFIYLVILVETTGTWFTISAVTGEELTDKRLNGAAVGEGIGCMLGAFFGGTPLTGYSSNAGVIAVTGIASRWAIMAGGIILIVLGMIPKLMNVIACIPGTVINGVFAIVAVFVMVNGMRVLKTVQLDERNMFIVGMPVLLGVTAAVIPAEILGSLPSLANYLFSSGTAVGAITAVLLNILIPQSKKSSEVVETQTATSAKS